MKSDDGEDESSFTTTDAEDKPKTKVGQSERIPSHKQVQDYVTCRLVLAPTSL